MSRIRLIIIWVNYERQKKGYFMKHRVYQTAGIKYA